MESIFYGKSEYDRKNRFYKIKISKKPRVLSSQRIGWSAFLSAAASFLKAVETKGTSSLECKYVVFLSRLV
jgi:hypothetical protein